MHAQEYVFFMALAKLQFSVSFSNTKKVCLRRLWFHEMKVILEVLIKRLFCT